MGVVVMAAVDMEEAEVVTMRVVAANLTTLIITQTTAVAVIRATLDIKDMRMEHMGIMTVEVRVAITVTTGDTIRATMTGEVIMGSIILGKMAGKVHHSVKMVDTRKGTPPRDLTT